MSAEIEEASGGRKLDSILRLLKSLGVTNYVFYLPQPEYLPSSVPCGTGIRKRGDIISTEDVLCQLEAMKMFTPMSLSSFSEGGTSIYGKSIRYKITRINMANGQQVNEGDLLFVIRKELDEI